MTVGANFAFGDGAVIETHKVVIYAAEQLSSTQRRWHAPPGYTDPDESGLTATIDGPTDSLVITLNWDGGKPFIEVLPQNVE